MNRRDFLARAGAGAAALASCAWPRRGTAATGPPNVLFLFADDLDPGAVHALGNAEVRTPNIDRIAARGTVFSNTYNMGAWHGAVCVASRTMLMTGAYLWRAQRLEPGLGAEAAAGRLWPLRMAEAGYETCFSGKWHVSMDPKKAFQRVAHVRPGMPEQLAGGYHRPPAEGEDRWKPWDTANGGYWEGGRHWSEVVADDAEEFLRRPKDGGKPLFLYLAFNAPHDPRQAPKEYLDLYPPDKIALPENYLPAYPDREAMGCGEDLRDEQLAPFPRTAHAVRVHRAEYYAIISHLDAQVGRILDALEASGRADNTLVVFSADNGLACGQHGLLGKQNMYGHSMRVPLIMAGPGIPAGGRVDAPVYLQDAAATALEMAGAGTWEGMEYRSLLPLLRGGANAARDTVYGAYMELQRMLVMDGFKLIHYAKAGKWMLFDLAADPHERTDLSKDPAHAGRLERMRARLAETQREMDDPLAG